MADSTAVAPVSAEERAALGIFTGGSLALKSSLPSATLAEKAAVLRLTADEAENVADYLNKVVTIHDITIHAVEVVDTNTGEVKSAVRTVMHCAGDVRIAAVSGGVVKSLAMLASIYGPPTWAEGIAVEIKQITTRAGRRTYSILPAPVVGVKGKAK